MSHVERHVVAITTTTGGAATAYTPTLTGMISQIRYVPGSPAFASTADFTVTAEATGETIWAEANVTAAKTVAPRQPVHTTSGATASGLAAPVALANDRVKIVVADGGNTKVGAVHVVLI